MKLKFISLNLWWGGNLFPQIIKFLKEQDADVVVLQEVHDAHDASLMDRYRSMDVLKDALSYPYREFALAHMLTLPEGVMPSGNAVLSKFPIKTNGIIRLFDPIKDEYLDVPEDWAVFPRILQHACLGTPAGEVNVFNIHGIWDLAGDNPSPQRETMVSRTLDALRGKPNVLLAGDTNASQGNPLLERFDAELTDVFGRKLKTTFNMRRKDKPGYATAAVDHMWVSPNIKVLSKDCPDVDISDHLPLVASLEL